MIYSSAEIHALFILHLFMHLIIFKLMFFSYLENHILITVLFIVNYM